MKKHFYFISGLFCISVFIYLVVLLSTYDLIDVIKYIGLASAIIGLIYSIVLSEKFNKLINSLRDEAMHDGMTGLLNHKFFEKRLDEEIERSERYKEKITLLFLDLDNFKRINDTYGHLFGDYVLKITASIIEENVRNIDIVSRYGGEEFIVILINANKKDSLKTAERIRKQIEEYEFIEEKISEHLTIIIGMGEFPTDAKNKENLIRYSDHKMYTAKNDGRNCIR